MKLVSIICLLLSFTFAGAQSWEYSLLSVPDSLKKNANVVVHLDHSELKVESPDNATLSNHRVYTIVNEDGKYALWFSEHSSRYTILDEVEIKVYDHNGKQLQKYKKKDLLTQGIGEGLIDDGFRNYLRIEAGTFPVTVDVKYEMKYKSSFFPAFYFIGPKEAVLEANYLVSLPASMTLRYKAQHTSILPVVSENGNKRTYKWSVKNLSPIEDEEGAVSVNYRYPHVSIVTDQFSYYGYEGNLSSWKNFGDWLNGLYTGLDELPEERKQFFINLVKDAPSESEKIKRIYQYMQNNFRYVSIQLGIGGLKPFPASFTDQKKYGDCKGLSNYMKAALKAVGIKSHIAIINARYNAEPVDPAFPANKFDHAILCVPGKDSIWLECTSSSAEFGKLGTFTENRNALLVTENGGVLVPTPKSDPASNTYTSRTSVTIENDLSAISETIISHSGSFSGVMQDILKANRDDQKKAIVFYMGYKQPDDFELKNDSTSRNTVLRMAIRKMSEFNSGDKYFINPRINKIWSSKLPAAKDRKMDFYFHFPFERRDTTILSLNQTLKIDVMPQEKEIRSDYGYYHSKSWFSEKENAVYTATTLILKRHKVLAKDYAAVKTFFDDVMQDDSQRIVMKRTESTVPEKKTF